MNVYTYKTDAMRRILQLVSRGYVRYTFGKCELKKLQSLICKFDDRYKINLTTQQRYRAKAKGEANTQLVLFFNEKTIEWWLLVTPGTGLIEELEILKNTEKRFERIELTGYSLCKTPKKGESASWSWRMTENNYLAWQERLRSSVIAKNDELIRQAMFSLKRTPAFSGSRKQAFTLFRQAKNHWRKINGSEWPYENIYIGWFGKFQKAQTIDSSELLEKSKKQLNKGKSSILLS